MKSSFPCGILRVCPELLALLPRSEFVRALCRHFTQEPKEGPIRSRFEHEGVAFVLLTVEDRIETYLKKI